MHSRKIGIPRAKNANLLECIKVGGESDALSCIPCSGRTIIEDNLHLDDSKNALSVDRTTVTS